VRITVTKAHSWNIQGGIDLHITNSQSTKEHAVIELCKMLGVNPANVAGVGDGHNDIHLFNSVGHKIAMGNAVADLKAVADQVIACLDEDGLAKFIEGSV
jgi:hydroxymethylpyrimidine pyrophosphatase-like HAD family hydrolase